MSAAESPIADIRHAARVLFAPGQCVEVRALVDGSGPWNGYFDNLDTLAEKIDALAADSRFTAFYWSLNSVDPDLLARRDNTIGRAVSGAGERDIIRRRWLLVDIDPERKSGIGATDAEKAGALSRGDAVAAHLAAQGWPAPVVGDSGNGCHLLYRIDLPNDADATSVVHRCLQALSARFSDEAVKVDTGVADAPRIIRIYGTPNRKGANRADRPHRRAALLVVPDAIEVVPIEKLQALAAEATETTSPSTPTTPAGIPSASTKAGDGPDLRAWLAYHSEKLAALGIVVREKAKNGQRFFGEFERCPWAKGAHEDGAYIGQAEHGGIYARCMHDSCGGTKGRNRWHEIRALVEPKPKKAEKGKKSDEEQPEKHVLAHFEKGGKLYFDVRDAKGVHYFAHLDDADTLAFAREVVGDDGITIVPRELPIHQDSGMPAIIVGLPSKEAMEQAGVLDAGKLFAAIDRHLEAYMDMPDMDRTLFIYYQFYTWFYRKARTAPYLRFLADTGKGKSRIIDTVSDLCFLPTRTSGASSFSGIFRIKEKWHGTPVLDESDLEGGASNQVVKYLNLGFEKGRPFVLSDKNNPGTQDTFDPFGPKIIGMRRPFGDNATEARVLSFSPRETRRRDIPVELNDAYDESVVVLRAHMARFALAHWADVTADAMMDVSDLEVEPRLKQLLRPLSLVLSVFPDGKERLIDYVRRRQIEIRRERAASPDGLFFNLALKLANGDEDLMDDPKFGKYYRHGEIQAVEARMIAAAMGLKSGAVTKALRGIGFATKDTSIKIQTVAKAKDGEQGRIGERKLTISKLIVPDARAWAEMVSRYYYVDQDDAPDDGQTTIDATARPKIPPCPGILRGPHYIDEDIEPKSTGGTGGTGGVATQPPQIIEVDPNCIESVPPGAPSAAPG